MVDAPRYFRPAFLSKVGLFVVAVDELQPVAVVYDRRGAQVRVVGWKQFGRPGPVVWSRRSVCVGGQSLWVDDGERGLVRIDVGGGEFAVRAVESKPDGPPDRHRLWRSKSKLTGQSGTWHARSELTHGGVAWSASALFEPEFPAVEPVEVDLGFGSVYAAVAVDEDLFVSVRRAGKRPWAFRPAVDLVRIDPQGVVTTVTDWNALDVAPYCHDLPSDAPSATSIVRTKVEQKLRSGERDLPDATDVSFTVSRWNADPVWELNFSHPLRPGVRLVRRELLRTEFGYPQNFGDLGIFLTEDLPCGFLPPLEWARDGVLRI